MKTEKFIKQDLKFNTLWANSAEINDIFIIFSTEDNLHEMSKPVFWEK